MQKHDECISECAKARLLLGVEQDARVEEEEA